MKKNDTIALNRIQSSIIADKRFKPENLTRVIKSEIYNVLSNYLLLEADNLNVNLKINEYGFLQLTINATAKRSKVLGILPDENSFI